MNNAKQFWKSVGEALAASSVSYRRLAQEIEMDPAQLSRLANGKVARPSFDTMRRVAAGVWALTGVDPLNASTSTS